MKKRILSLCLLLAMVVTALPLAALTVFAVGGSVSYEEDDYNALYVQDDLIFAADFFKSNSIWNTTGGASSTNLNDYVWTETASTTAAKFVLSGGNVTLFDNAISGGALLMDKIDATYLYVSNTAALTNKSQGGTTGEYVGKFTSAGENVFALNDLRAKVYIESVDSKRVLSFKSLGFFSPTQLKVRTGDGKVLAFNAPAASGVVTTMTMSFDVVAFAQDYYGTYPMLRFAPAVTATPEQLSAANITNSTSWQANFYVTHEGDENGVKPLAKVKVINWLINTPVTVKTDKIWDEASQTYVTDPAGEKTYIVGSARRDGGDGDVTADFMKNNTYGADGGGTQGGFETDDNFYTTKPGSFSIYMNGVEAYKSDDVYFPDNSNQNVGGSNTFLKRQTTYAGTNLYAFRQYSRMLSTSEMAQNHFADLAKWFKIDLGYVNLLSGTSLTELYTFAAGLTFEDTTAGEQLEEKAIALVAEQYAGKLNTDALAIIAGYGIDITRIALFPDEYANLIFADLESYIPGKVAAEIQAFVDHKVQETLNTYYSKYIDTTVYDYRDLYVRQDDLMLAADFFAAKPTDTPVYVGKTYPTWQAQYTAAADATSDGYWKNLTDENGDPLYKVVGDKMYFAGEEVASEAAGLSAARRWLTANKEVVIVENNWNDYFDTYVWKGTNSMLTPLDIGDASGYYAHDNIRRFGDGCLITGKNNSMTVRFSYDTDDVTYQFVTKMSGSGNWQLRGFRTTFSGLAQSLKFIDYSYNGYAVTGTKDNPSASKIALISKTLSPTPEVSAVYSTDVTAVVDKYNDVGASYFKFTWNESTKKYDVVQVATEAESNSGGVSFFGRLDLNLYANGNRVLSATNLPYNAGAPDSVGNGGANTYYAIRVYRCTLTPEEIAQNHFADLAGYYGYDLSLYYRLSDDARAVLHSRLKSLELGSPRAEALKKYETLFNELYYVFDVDSEASDLFRDLAASYKLKIENLAPLSPLSQERIFQYFTTDAMLAKDTVAPVLQDNLERKIVEVKENHYAEAFVHTISLFRGYQLTKEGELGFRTLFALNREELQKIRAMYPTANITIGTLLVPSELADEELVTLKTDGGVEFHEGVVVNTVAYSGTGVSADTFDYKDGLAYACEYYPEDIEEKISFTNYVVIELEGEDSILYTVKAATAPISEDGISLLDLTRYAKETEGMAYENVQSVMNGQEGTYDVVLSLGNGNISDYVIVKDDWNAAGVDRVLGLIEEYVGIAMRVVTEEEAALYERCFYIGRDCDVNYEDADLYGLTLSPYTLSLWYFTEENGETAVDLFEELLSLALDEEIYTVETGTEYVRRAR